MNDYDARNIDDFFASLQPWESAYRHIRLTYLATPSEDCLKIISACITLDYVPFSPLKPLYISEILQAGQCDFQTSSIGIANAFKQILTPEGLKIEGHGQLRLADDPSNSISVSSPMQLHFEGTQKGERLAKLIATGASRWMLLPQPDIDWRLKAQPIPYDSINELLLDYSVGSLSGDRTSIEIVARAVVEVWGKSFVHGTKARIGLFIPVGLPHNDVRLGFRVLHDGVVIKRGSVLGKDLDWENDALFEGGIIELEVPLGATIQCIASYKGDAHQVKYFNDPNLIQNPRASAYALIDPSWKILNEQLTPVITKTQKTNHSDDFEAAVCRVFWMMGFATVSFGLTAKTTDFVDVVAVSENGSFLFIECTLSILKAESKIPKLLQRAISFRSRLKELQLDDAKVIPVIVTALPLNEVKAEVDIALKDGIFVITRDFIEQIQPHLLQPANADTFVAEILRSLHQSNFNQTLRDA
jgi:hypothetical protein